MSAPAESTDVDCDHVDQSGHDENENERQMQSVPNREKTLVRLKACDSPRRPRVDADDREFDHGEHSFAQRSRDRCRHGVVKHMCGALRSKVRQLSGGIAHEWLVRGKIHPQGLRLRQRICEARGWPPLGVVATTELAPACPGTCNPTMNQSRSFMWTYG